MDLTLYPREWVQGADMTHMAMSVGEFGISGSKLVVMGGACGTGFDTAIEILDLDNEAAGWQTTLAVMPVALHK